jgi:hypothetical protein
MTKTAMPGGTKSYNSEHLWSRDPGRQAKGVYRTRAIGPKDHVSRS